MVQNLAYRLKSEAASIGFSQIGISRAKPASRLGDYMQWIGSGFHGEMNYLARPDRLIRRKNLNEILPGVRSIISVTLDYRTITLPKTVTEDPSRARISNYAWGIDYHELLGQKLSELADKLKRWSHEVKTKAYVDTGAIIERGHGEAAGLGFTGKNTMLISPRGGSFFFIGQLLSTVELDTIPFANTIPSCGTCQRCLDFCPTNAFPKPYVLDARKCISYLTIELKGWIPRDMRPLMGNWIYGCDICQDVCPFNRFAKASEVNEFFPTDLDAAAPSLIDILQLNDDEFSGRFASSPIKRIKRRGIVRNACVAAGNWGSKLAVPALQALLHDDESIVRGHAAWALGQIGGPMSARALQDAANQEGDGQATREINIALGQLSY